MIEDGEEVKITWKYSIKKSGVEKMMLLKRQIKDGTNKDPQEM